ncbi:hypothetical protein Salat_2261900 [Sesamum alatum]|uniref:LRAT domain-containing protein n=1 Tax=Sesamum alatum TaxID=300844 RepID=A0AAE2CDU1_9LAMI|nr:hypothetical protein Salat_2261900 [Sesamum alatum]
MGLLTNRVERSEIKAGDHIYTYRAIFAYSHHGIFVGGSKVVHFTRVEASSRLNDEAYSLTAQCPSCPDCGFRQPNSGVVLSCLDCFLRNGSLYAFEYGVSPSVFIAKVRGGTCTTAASDPPHTVVHRAMYLLQNGIWTMTCSKTTARILPSLLSSPLKLLMPSPVGVATMTAGMYCMSRYATDIGVRSDVIKVAVEDLAVNLGWGNTEEVATPENVNSNKQLIR